MDRDARRSVDRKGQDLKGLANGIAAFDSKVNQLNTGKTHNLNNVGMAFWALQTMLIPQPFILTGVAEDEFSLLFALVGHIMS